MPDAQFSSFLSNPNYQNRTDRSKTSFTSIPINNQPAEGGTLAISSHASLHKNSTAGSFLLSATLTNQPQNLPLHSEFQLGANKMRVASTHLEPELTSGMEKTKAYLQIVAPPQTTKIKQREKQIISIHGIASISGGESSFQEAVKLNNSFNLRTQRNNTQNLNVRPSARPNLFSRKSTSANKNNIYAQRAMARLECLKDPEAIVSFASAKNISRNIAYQKIKDSRSDLDSGEDTQQPKARAKYMSAHIPLQEVVNSGTLQSNSSSNILVEASMITSPAGTLHSNRRFQQKTQLNGHNQFFKTTSAVGQNNTKLMGTIEARLGIHDSTEQSQFMHGSSIDEGPTSPRGIHWATEGRTTGRAGTNRSGVRQIVTNENIHKGRKNSKQRVKANGSSRKDIGFKNMTKVETENMDRDFSSTFISDHSIPKILMGKDSPQLNFSPVSSKYLLPEGIQYRHQVRPLIPGSLPARELKNPPQPIFMPSSRKPQQTRVVNYKSCSAKNMLRVNAFDQRVWAPSMQGYLTLQSKHRQNMTVHAIGLSENALLDYVAQQQQHQILYQPRSTFYQQRHVMSSDKLAAMPRPDSEQSRRVTTSVLSKHKSFTQYSGQASSGKKNEKRRSLMKVRESRIEETNNPSLTAMSIREEIPRAKSVNTQTNPSVDPTMKRDPSDNLLCGSSSTPQVVLPIGKDILAAEVSPPQSVALKKEQSRIVEGAETEYMIPKHARKGKEQSSQFHLSSEAYESVDYSQIASSGNLQPKGVPGPSLLKNLSSQGSLVKKDELMVKKQESLNSIHSSGPPHSPYAQSQRRLEEERSGDISRQNSNNPPQLAAFTFDVEVKKARNGPEKPRKSKKKSKKFTSSREVGAGVQPPKEEQIQTKQIEVPQSPPHHPKSRKTSKAKYKTFHSAGSSKLESPKSRTLKVKEFHLQTPGTLNQGMGLQSFSPHYGGVAGILNDEQNHHLRPSSTSPKAMSGGGGNMKVFRGKALVLNAKKGQSPYVYEEGPPNSDIFKDGTASPFPAQGEQSLEAGQDSDYKSIEQQQMSLKRSRDKPILYKKASLSPKQRPKGGVLSSDSISRTLAKMSRKEEEMYGSLSDRAQPLSSSNQDSLSPVKKRVISKYKQTKMANRGTPHQLGPPTPVGVPSKLEKNRSHYKSQFTDLTSHIQSQVEVQHEHVALVDVLGMSNTVSTLKEDMVQEEVITKIAEAELIPTQDSPLQSPMMQNRLPHKKYKFDQVESRSPSRIEFGQMEAVRGRAPPSLKPLGSDVVSPQFSASQGLPTATFESQVKSGIGQETSKSPSRVQVQMVSQREKRKSSEIKPSQQRVKSSPVSPLHDKSQRFQKQIMSFDRRIPLSMSSVQLLPVEELEVEDLKMSRLMEQDLGSQHTFKNMKSQLELKDVKESKGERAALKRNNQIPPKLKRPFIGSKNQPGPVPPHHLSPYSSKHGRITKRSAGAWCQLPQSMVPVRSQTPGSVKNVWGFYSAGPQDWSQMLKNMTEMSRASSTANIESVMRQSSMGRRSSTHTKTTVQRPMTTPELRQRTIAIKMKSISYDSGDSVHTSKERLGQSSGRHISQIPNSPSSLNKSNSFLKIRSRANSAAAIDTVKSFLVNESRKNSVKQFDVAGLGLKQSRNRSNQRKMNQNRSAHALTTVTLTGASPQRTKSVHLLGMRYQSNETVMEEPLQQAVVSARVQD